jgi:hypothetical protein
MRPLVQSFIAKPRVRCIFGADMEHMLVNRTAGREKRLAKLQPLQETTEILLPRGSAWPIT